MYHTYNGSEKICWGKNKVGKNGSLDLRWKTPQGQTGFSLFVIFLLFCCILLFEKWLTVMAMYHGKYTLSLLKEGGILTPISDATFQDE